MNSIFNSILPQIFALPNKTQAYQTFTVADVIWVGLKVVGNRLRSHAIGITYNINWVIEIESLNFQSQPLNKKLLKIQKTKSEKVKEIMRRKKELYPYNTLSIIWDLNLSAMTQRNLAKKVDVFMHPRSKSTGTRLMVTYFTLFFVFVFLCCIRPKWRAVLEGVTDYP